MNTEAKVKKVKIKTTEMERLKNINIIKEKE